MGIFHSPLLKRADAYTMKQIILACVFAVVAFQLADAKKGNKGKGRGKGQRGDKKSAICEEAEEGSEMAFKCSCFAVMKVKRDERSDEQKALAKECMAKRKEHKESKKEEKETSSSDEDSEKKENKFKAGWKSKVKACRRAKKAIKDGHATEKQTAFAEENCQKMKGGKRKDRKQKKQESAESDAESGEEGKGKRKKRGRKARGPKAPEEPVVNADDQE